MSKRPKKGEFPDADKMMKSAEDAAQIIGRQGIRSALIGGFAMQFYGSLRLTQDVDFAALADPSMPTSWPDTGRRLTFGGRRVVSPYGVFVDILVRSDAYRDLYQEAVQMAIESEEGLLIVRPEYLAAIKLAARRPKDEDDLIYLLSVPDLVNIREARNIIGKHLGGKFAEDEFSSFVEEAKWRRKRESRSEEGWGSGEEE